MPLNMDVTQQFLLDTATEKCKRLLPECEFSASSLLVKALAKALETTEDELCL